MAYYGNPYMPIQKKPVPPPDKNWVDHVQENRKYLRSIRTVNISKNFEGLNDSMLFLMEVSTDSVEFNKAISDTLQANKEGNKGYKLYVKFLDFLFWEVNGKGEELENPKESPSYSDLFHSMFSPAKPDIPVESFCTTNLEKEMPTIRENQLKDVEIIPEFKEETKKTRDKTPSSKKSTLKKSKGKKDSKGSKSKGGSKDSDGGKEGKVNKDVESKEDKETPTNKMAKEEKDETTSKGKGALFVMKGEGIIRSLQEHAINVKVTRIEEKKEDLKKEGPPVVTSSATLVQKKPEEVVIGTAAFRVPEALRLAILSFVGKNTTLPAKEKHSDTYKLIGTKKEEVGKVNVTVTLSCFGKVVENCIREYENDDEDRYVYEHTKCWRKFAEKKFKIPKINPELALQLLKASPPIITPSSEDSEEVLRHCIGWGIVKVDKDEKKRVLRKNDCEWHTMVKQARSETDSKYEAERPLTPLKTPMRLMPSASSSILLKSEISSSKSVFKLTSTILASRTIVGKSSGWPITCLSKTFMHPNTTDDRIDLEQIRQETEIEDLKPIWMKMRRINDAFKEELIERKGRKKSVFERLEKLKLEAPDITRTSKVDQTKASIKSS